MRAQVSIVNNCVGINTVVVKVIFSDIVFCVWSLGLLLVMGPKKPHHLTQQGMREQKKLDKANAMSLGVTEASIPSKSQPTSPFPGKYQCSSTSPKKSKSSSPASSESQSSSLSHIPYSSPVIYSSLDVREKLSSSTDIRTTSVIIEEMTRISRQKKGDHFLPNLRRMEAKSLSCVLCSIRGNTCLGNCCFGTSPSKTRPSKTRRQVKPTPGPSSIPGSMGDKSSSLLEITRTPTSELSKIHLSADCSKMFRKQPTPDYNHEKSHSVGHFKKPVHNNSKTKVVGGPAVNFDYIKMRKVLLNAKLNQRSSKIKVSTVCLKASLKPRPKSSTERKLETSEKCCARKVTSKEHTPVADKSNSSLIDHFQASKLPHLHPTWGHYIGGLKGGSPVVGSPVVSKIPGDSQPKANPVFANSESDEECVDKSKKIFAEESDSSDKSNDESKDEPENKFAGESDSSDSETDCESDSLRNYQYPNVNIVCEPLPTIHVPIKNVSSKQIKSQKILTKCECDKRCVDVIEDLTVAEIEEIKLKFVGKTLTETKNIILSHLKSQEDVLGMTEKGFFFRGHSYCGTAFSKLTGISRFILRKIQDAHDNHLVKFVHNNSQMPKNCPRKVNAICWFKSFCQIYGQRAPDSQVAVLPSWLNATTVFQMYKEENPRENEQIKYSTFCKMLKKDFGQRRSDKRLPRVRFSKYSTHSVCSECYDLDAFQRTCRTEKDLLLCRALMFKHRERYSGQYRCIQSIRQLSQTFPDQHISIFIDSMDNQKSHIPRFIEKTKNLANFWKLPSKVTGCLVYSAHYPENRKVKMFLNFDQYEQGLFLLLQFSVT